MGRASRKSSASASTEAIKVLDRSNATLDELKAAHACLTGTFAAVTDATPRQSGIAAAEQAKTLTVLAVQLVKKALIRLSVVRKDCRSGAILGQLAGLGIDVLDACRDTLKGRFFEVELQRYTLARQLAARGIFQEALQQGWLAYIGACKHWAGQDDFDHTQQPPVPKLAGPKATNYSKESAAVVVGVIVSLVFCSVELPASQASQQLHRLQAPLNCIPSWLR